MKLLLVLLSLLAASAFASAPSFLLLIDGTTIEQAVQTGLPVLGSVGSVVVVLQASREKPVSLPTGASILARTLYNPATFTYLVAEDNNVQAWSSYASEYTHIVWQEPGHALFRTEAIQKGAASAFLSSTEVIALPTKPIRPVPADRLERLRTIAAQKLGFRQDVADLVAAVDTNSLQEYVRYFTGEDVSSPLLSRNSYSEGGVVAGMWAEKLFQEAGFTTVRPVFNDLYCPNVVAELRGTDEPNKIVVLGAHLDDRAANVNDPAQRAPGANDDGSGSSMLLEVARVLRSLNATFRYTLRIIAFCGEEQGLVGSRAYAAQIADEGEDVVAMLQGDMIAYQAGTQPELSFVSRYTDATLTGIVTNITATYVPTLRLSTTTACCSDHQSFIENGYASAGFVEAGGYTIDPQYHKVGDLSERTGYSFQQLSLITQALLASTAVLAELN